MGEILWHFGYRSRAAQRLVRVVFLAIVMSVGALHDARGAATTFSVVNYRPTTDRAEFQVVRQSRNLFKLQWHAGTQTVFGYRILEERTTDRHILDRLLLQHFYGGIGITDWLSVGLDVPVALNAHFQDPAPATAPGFQNKFSLGDIRAEFKGSILNRYKSPVGIAINPYVTIPVGKKSQFLGDGTVSGGGSVVADAEFWRKLVVALNVGVEARRPVDFRNIQISTASLIYGAGAAVRLTPKADLSAEIFGRTPAKRIFKERAESPAEILIGGHYQIGKKGLAISAGAGAGVVHGAGGPLVRGFVGVSYLQSNAAFAQKQEALERMKYVTLKGASPVKWNIVELRATCPVNAANFDPNKDDPRCPKYYELRDVADLILKCPNKAEDFNPAKHDAACQKVYTLRESLSREDYATVYVLSTADLEAKCPANPSLFNPKIHSASCPKYFELKEVLALVSKCPARVEDFNPAKHDASCPKVFEFREAVTTADWKTVNLLARADADDDGIPDFEDRCPTVPGVATARGCPEKEVLVTGGVIQPKVPVRFIFNSAQLNAEAMQALDEVITTLNAHPEIGRVRIEGYADSVGSPKVNQWISSARANAVKNYLWSKGISPKRLRAIGFGESHPVAPNTTPEGRALNRRAIFLVIEK